MLHMKHDYNVYWEKCWKEDDSTELYKYLDKYFGMKCKEIEIFHEHNIVNVCDAACGIWCLFVSVCVEWVSCSKF